MVASVLVVGGTHGNECNAPWLLQQWGPSFAALQRPRLKVQTAPVSYTHLTLPTKRIV